MVPIIQRELLVVARKKSTYWVRVGTSGAAAMVSFSFLLISVFLGRVAPTLGPTSFNVLSWYAFGLSLLAGLYLTADCISEEKREGTLGLLFLTNLTGVEIVLGKFISSSLNALYGLLAIFPILGLPILIGGVTGTQFFHVSLALVDILIFGLVAGMFASVLCRETFASITATILLILAVIVFLPLLTSFVGLGGISNYLAWLSPLGAFKSALLPTLTFGASFHSFWSNLVVSTLFSLGLLIAAGLLLPLRLQEKSLPAKSNELKIARWFIHGKKRPLLDGDPVVWLVDRTNPSARIAWGTMLIGTALALMTFLVTINLAGTGAMIRMTSLSYIVTVTGFIVKVVFSFQACRLFADSRKSGAFELIACTPLKDSEIIRGQWQSLKKAFLYPVMIFCVVVGFLQVASYLNFNGIISATFTRAKFPPGVGRSGLIFNSLQSNSGLYLMSWTAAVWVYQVVRIVTDFLALGWMGMWLAITLKKPTQAAGLNLLFVVLIPSFVFCIPTVLTDLFFIFWARRKMREDFRGLVFPQTKGTNVPAALAAAPPPVIN